MPVPLPFRKPCLWPDGAWKDDSAPAWYPWTSEEREAVLDLWLSGRKVALSAAELRAVNGLMDRGLSMHLRAIGVKRFGHNGEQLDEVIDEFLVDTFLRKWDRFDETKTDGGTLKAYWSTAFRRQCNDADYVGEQVEELADFPDKAAPMPDVDPEAIERALDRLPEEDRQILRLKYWDELSNTDIGAKLEISVAAVAMRLFRARKAWADAYQKGAQYDRLQ
jgi:RNA polymerase sigma factor (sigma-70 family)